jgi:HEAT repeat protein
VRLVAGRGLREAGRTVLLALATDAAVEDSCSAEAIDALRTLPSAPARAVLEAALRPGPDGRLPGRPLTARACVDAMARDPDPEHLPLLVRVTASRASSLWLVLAAVKALGAIGTADAVLPLQEAARLHGEDVEKAARRVLADIQVMLAGTPGQVSLAAAGEGHVALVDDTAGRVAPTPGDGKD